MDDLDNMWHECVRWSPDITNVILVGLKQRTTGTIPLESHSLHRLTFHTCWNLKKGILTSSQAHSCVLATSFDAGPDIYIKKSYRQFRRCPPRDEVQ